MLVQNTFDNLMDSSLGVRYGVADIQGNTFEKLTGKPFVDMRPMIETVSTYWSNFSINFIPKKIIFFAVVIIKTKKRCLLIQFSVKVLGLGITSFTKISLFFGEIEMKLNLAFKTAIYVNDQRLLT